MVVPPDDEGPKGDGKKPTRAPSRKPQPSSDASEVVSSPATPPTTPAEPADPSFSRLAAVALQTFAFPLLLAIIVGLYVVLQHWFDRRDPKLAVAPVHSNHDLAAFG